MKKEKYFTSYDFETNPDDYTEEELITVKEMLEAGKPVYRTPIVIEDESQFETLHINHSQCRTWRIGREIHLVHLTPASESVYQFIMTSLEKERRTAYRLHRCLIPGQRKVLRRCPDYFSCDHCPFQRGNDTKQAHIITLTKLLKGEEPIDETKETLDERVIRMDEYLQIYEALQERNEKFLHALILHSFYGYTADEISDLMQETSRNVYYFLDEAKKIIRKTKEQQ